MDNYRDVETSVIVERLNVIFSENAVSDALREEEKYLEKELVSRNCRLTGKVK